MNGWQIVKACIWVTLLALLIASGVMYWRFTNDLEKDFNALAQSGTQYCSLASKTWQEPLALSAYPAPLQAMVVNNYQPTPEEVGKMVLNRHRASHPRIAVEPISTQQWWAFLYTQHLHYLVPDEQVLSVYLNNAYLGGRKDCAILGFNAAAAAYFQKPLVQLSIAEQAYLVGLIATPNSTEKALARRNSILQQALERGILTQPQYEQALHES